MNKKPDIEVISFGCRLNTLESQVMKQAAISAGLDDAILINTCAVTQEAERQACQAIRRAARTHPGKKIIVSGCAAQTNAQRFAAMEEVNLVLGNEEKLHTAPYHDVPDFGVAAAEKIRVNDIFLVQETAGHLIEGLDGRTRAFVQVQNGCDHRCTFCIIPFGRGRSRSVPMGVVVDQIQRLVENGYREVVLTGVDLTSYGADLPTAPKLGQLVHTILRRVPELQRLRLSSIDSIEVDPELMQVLAEEPRFMPHLHLSLQSGDNMILKRMKRRHLRDDVVDFCKKARQMRPDVVFGADLIAGFPTETEDMFQNSLRLIEECDLTYLHVFPFSSRAGTPAARMPQLERSIIKQRAVRLRKKGAEVLKAKLKAQIGTVQQVLVEKPDFGRTEQFMQVELDNAQSGDIVSARITDCSDRHMFGVCI